MCILLCFGVDSLRRVVVILKPPVLKCLHTCEYITWEMQYYMCPHLQKIAMTIQKTVKTDVPHCSLYAKVLP